eukprot:2075212-Amphidinium_carterae.1
MREVPMIDGASSMKMATIVTRATPSGTHADGGAMDTTTALQAFTAIRLDAPKEYRQLFGSAAV